MIHIIHIMIHILITFSSMISRSVDASIFSKSKWLIKRTSLSSGINSEHFRLGVGEYGRNVRERHVEGKSYHNYTHLDIVQSSNYQRNEKRERAQAQLVLDVDVFATNLIINQQLISLSLFSLLIWRKSLAASSLTATIKFMKPFS